MIAVQGIVCRPSMDAASARSMTVWGLTPQALPPVACRGLLHRARRNVLNELTARIRQLPGKDDVFALLSLPERFNLETAVGHVRMGRHGDVLGRRDNAAGYCPQGGATPQRP